MTSGILTSTENFDVEAESSELLRSACELVHVRCAKLISVKAKVLLKYRTVLHCISFFVMCVGWFIRMSHCSRFCSLSSSLGEVHW